jgi:hypothetical protein
MAGASAALTDGRAKLAAACEKLADAGAKPADGWAAFANVTAKAADARVKRAGECALSAEAPARRVDGRAGAKTVSGDAAEAASGSADFPVGCIADFQIRALGKAEARPVFQSAADFEIGDTAGWETCAT